MPVAVRYGGRKLIGNDRRSLGFFRLVLLGFLLAVVYHYSVGGYGALALCRARHR